MLFAFRGRFGFLFCIPSKPVTYGIKIQALVDTKSFYTGNLEIYAGKQPTGPYSVSNMAYDVIERLVQPVSDTNGDITVDNWLTNHELMGHLLNEHRLTTAGTIRKNKSVISAGFLKISRVPESFMFGHQKNVSMVSYVPKINEVFMVMSSIHHDAKIDNATREQKSHRL